jgi:UDP-perosamine 4-acetyltransferase
MRSDIIVIGAGGHAKVCIEIIREMGQRVAFCVAVADETNCMGIPVLKDDIELLRLYEAGYRLAFPAVGSNGVRARVAAYASEIGFQLITAVSPHAVVSPTAKLGSGVAVMPGAIINADAVIGDISIINTGATIDHDCRIGSAVHVAPQCALGGNVTVGDRTFLGIGCKVIPEVTLGADVMAGAGSVVIADISSNLRVAGVPAKPLR